MVKIYLSCVPEDNAVLSELLNFINKFDSVSLANSSVNKESSRREILSSDIFIALISPNYIASNNQFGSEFQLAIEKYKTGKIRKIISIIARPSSWRGTIIENYLILPSHGIPIRNHENQPEIFARICSIIKLVVSEIQEPRGGEKWNGIEVETSQAFPLQGNPKWNFIDPPSYGRLISSLKQEGRGIVIEGPTGIGKSTIIKNALKDRSLKYREISCRNPEGVKTIESELFSLEGIVIIDDFHRLNTALGKKVSDYLVYLADLSVIDRKLIVIGIPDTGKSLIRFGFDLARRIEVIKMDRVSDEKIYELILRGEQPLNISITNKTEIVSYSDGSPLIAQFLANLVTHSKGIYSTKETTFFFEGDVKNNLSSLMDTFFMAFETFLKSFCSISHIFDLVPITILKEVAIAPNNSINIFKLLEQFPRNLKTFNLLIEEKRIETILSSDPEFSFLASFDPIDSSLKIEDTRLISFLKYIESARLAELVGKKTRPPKDKIFICYSRNDSNYLNMLLDKLDIIDDQDIEVWHDQEIPIGRAIVDEIMIALKKTRICILLISADFLMSDFIVNIELPEIIRKSEIEDTYVIPIYLKKVNLNRYPELELDRYLGVNGPNEYLEGLSEEAQTKVFNKLIDRISNAF